MKLKINDLTLIMSGTDKEIRAIKKFVTYKDTSACMSGGSWHAERAKDICLGKSIREYFVVFAGLTKEILIFCKENGIKIEEFEDNRTHFDFQKKDWTYEELRSFFPKEFSYVEHQIRALQAMIKTNTGIIKACTSAGKCLSGDTKINVDGKEIKIEDLFDDDFKEEEVRKTSGHYVLTEKGYREIEGLYKTNKREVIELVLNNGNKIIGVPEHRVYTNSGWKFLKDLKDGDLILCQCQKKSKKRGKPKTNYVGIKSITKLEKKINCFDIQVADTHSFFGNGILNHNTSIIKSFMKLTNIPTLVLVDKVTLGSQLVDDIRSYGLDCGFCSGKGIKEGYHMVSTIQSVKKITDLDRYKCLLVDESHLSSSKTFQDFFKQFGCPLKFGFTASPFNGDYLRYAMMRQFLGSIIVEVNSEELIENEVMAKPTLYFIKNECEETFDYRSAYDINIVNSVRRNDKVITLANMYDRGVAILVTSLDQGKYLESKIPGSKFIAGENTLEERKQAIKDFNNGDLRVLIGSNILNTGISISNMYVLIMAASQKAQTTTIQRVGRCLRITETKKTAIYYDFIDCGNKFLEKHSKQRVFLFKKEGYKDIHILDEDLKEIENAKKKVEH